MIYENETYRIEKDGGPEEGEESSNGSVTITDSSGKKHELGTYEDAWEQKKDESTTNMEQGSETVFCIRTKPDCTLRSMTHISEPIRIRI